MPKKEEKGYWFSTENGTHIHAEEGESKESAMKKKFSKFGKTDSKKKTYDKMRKVLAKEGYPVDSYSDEEVDRAFTSLEKSIDAEDDKWHDKQQKKLTFEKVIKSADDDTLDEEFGKGTPERKIMWHLYC